MVTVLAPFRGVVLELAAVPDQVFAGGMVGSGACLEPAGEPLAVLAPIAGRVAVLRSHAFVVAGAGHQVLVHLGIDSAGAMVTSAVVAEGAAVAAGAAVMRWDPTSYPGCRLTPVVALQEAPERVRVLPSPGTRVEAGAPLFHLT